MCSFRCLDSATTKTCVEEAVKAWCSDTAVIILHRLLTDESPTSQLPQLISQVGCGELDYLTPYLAISCWAETYKMLTLMLPLTHNDATEEKIKLKIKAKAKANLDAVRPVPSFSTPASDMPWHPIYDLYMAHIWPALTSQSYSSSHCRQVHFQSYSKHRHRRNVTSHHFFSYYDYHH